MDRRHMGDHAHLNMPSRAPDVLDPASPLARLERWLPLVLAFFVIACYLPSLSGGFLNWDDPWLIEENPMLERTGFGVLTTVFLDLSQKTRLVLGAEYLPLRDLSLWLDVQLFGKNAQAMRLTQLALYLAAVLFFRAALRRTLPTKLGAELAAFVFALHPLHVESAAWLAGRKDVLSLLFLGAALFVHAGQQRGKLRLVLVPLLLLCAHLSKSMSVIALGLLLAQDLLLRRRPELVLYLSAAGVAVASFLVHHHVGGIVGMTGSPVGGSRFAAAATMGPVFLRYAGLLVWPPSASLVHDVPTRTHFDALSIASYAVFVIWAGIALWFMLRRKEPRPLAALLWFSAPLVPVSQVLFPLQNLMADRYLWLSVMALALALGWLAELRPKVLAPAVALATLLLSAATSARASLFADSREVFADATHKTTRSGVAPYMMAKAHEDASEDALAIASYELVLSRVRGNDEIARRATNNLARLYARHGRLSDAEVVLVRGRELWPHDPKVARNLVKVRVKQGLALEHDEAARPLESHESSP
jgi:hypothetical protein